MHTTTFEPVATSARAAREFVRQCLVAVDHPDPELAVLLVSELATNAIVHVGQPFVVWVDPSGPCLRVGVDDPSPGLAVPDPPDLSDTNGRGLAMVAALADRWGTEATAHGKRMWFQICG